MIKTSLGGGLTFIPFICGAHLIAWNLIDPSVLSLLSSRIHELEFSLVSCINFREKKGSQVSKVMWMKVKDKKMKSG